MWQHSKQWQGRQDAEHGSHVSCRGLGSSTTQGEMPCDGCNVAIPRGCPGGLALWVSLQTGDWLPGALWLCQQDGWPVSGQQFPRPCGDALWTVMPSLAALPQSVHKQHCEIPAIRRCTLTAKLRYRAHGVRGGRPKKTKTGAPACDDTSHWVGVQWYAHCLANPKMKIKMVPQSSPQMRHAVQLARLSFAVHQRQKFHQCKMDAFFVCPQMKKDPAITRAQ